MYVPASFQVTDEREIREFLLENSFAALVSNSDNELFATHLNLLLAPGENTLVGHLASANPHWRALSERPAALAIFQGPHGYISPTWYASERAVPTWNYAVVHAYGKVELIDGESATLEVLHHMVDRYESHRSTPWSIDQLDEALLKKLLKSIVAFRIKVDRWEAKFKFGQNRAEADVAGMLDGLRAETGEESKLLADAIVRYRNARPSPDGDDARR